MRDGLKILGPDRFRSKKPIKLRWCIDPVNFCPSVIFERMSTQIEDNIKRWTANRKAAWVMEIMQGKTPVSEAS